MTVDTIHDEITDTLRAHIVAGMPDTITVRSAVAARLAPPAAVRAKGHRRLVLGGVAAFSIAVVGAGTAYAVSVATRPIKLVQGPPPVSASPPSAGGQIMNPRPLQVTTLAAAQEFVGFHIATLHDSAATLVSVEDAPGCKACGVSLTYRVDGRLWQLQESFDATAPPTDPLRIDVTKGGGYYHVDHLGDGQYFVSGTSGTNMIAALWETTTKVAMTLEVLDKSTLQGISDTRLDQLLQSMS